MSRKKKQGETYWLPLVSSPGAGAALWVGGSGRFVVLHEVLGGGLTNLPRSVSPASFQLQPN